MADNLNHNMRGRNDRAGAPCSAGVPAPSPITVKDWLIAATTKLRGAGIDSARLDAKLLLQEQSGMSSGELIAQPERELGTEIVGPLELMLARRLAHEPVSRILGWREFYGRRFKITTATLDPRPDSETLIDAALQLAKREDWQDKPIRIIDVGTGSGCLLLTLLAELPAASGLGTDISGAAIEIAQQNAETLGLARRVVFQKTDSLEGVNEVFHLLVSNPPYIPSDDIALLMPDVRQFDPLGALDGGADGLDIYRAIGRDLSRVITEGYALFEVGAGQADAVAGQLAAANLEWTPEKGLNLRDLAGYHRVVAMRPMIGGK